MARPLPDDLDKPLGTDLAAFEGNARKIRYGRMALAGVGALAAGLAAYVYVTSDTRSGESVAVAAIQVASPVASTVPPQVGAPVATDGATGTILPRKRIASAEDIEGSSGVKVTRPGGGSLPSAVIIEVPEALGIHLGPAPDDRLVEKAGNDVLPKIGADGSRPSVVYARPVVMPPGLNPGAPRIAIVVGGMGLSRSGTADAVAKLPGEITLAFAPYGSDLVSVAAQARESGHEILLQAPMEPFDYPANDPGPRTLLSSSDAAQNLVRLHWLMSRFPGYVGIINFLGAKFTADTAAFAPVLRDIADRGLIYADDGTSSRSLASQLAPSLALPLVSTDVVIDAGKDPQAIDAALERLETVARQKGLAVGSATGLPITLDRIERWAAGLEARGIALVPLSAAAERLARASAGGVQDGR